MIWVIGVGLVTAVGISHAAEVINTLDYSISHKGVTPDRDLFYTKYKSRGHSIKRGSSPTKGSHRVENWIANKIKGVV